MFSHSGSMACVIFMQGRAFRPGSNDWRRETREMSNLLAEASQRLRIDYGPGYRVYFTKRGREIVILLAGADKNTQSSDIKTALRLARKL